jgi:hypothetical protein
MNTFALSGVIFLFLLSSLYSIPPFQQASGFRCEPLPLTANEIGYSQLSSLYFEISLFSLKNR